MSRTRRFLGGLGYGYLNQAVLMLVGLWLTPFLLGRLGQHDYGLWLVATQILGYLLLADVGVVALLPRETAYALGRGGESAREISRLVGRTLSLVLCQVPLVALAGLAVWLLLPARWEGLRAPLAWVLVGFVLVFPLRLVQAVLQGLQDLAFLGRAQLATWLFSTAVTVVLVLRGVGLSALVAGWLAGQVASAAVLWLRLRRRFPEVLPAGPAPLTWASTRGYLASGGWMSVGQVAQALLGSTDLMILGALLGPAAVVPYACTAKLISVLANQPQMVMQVAVPALAEMRTAEPRERLFQVSAALTQAMLVASGAIACVVLAVNRDFVAWWVGPELYGGLGLTALLAAGMLLRHWNTTAVFANFSFGRERRVSLLGLADGLVTVGASILLVRLVGPLGAALGPLLGVCLVTLPGNLTTLAREAGVPLPRLLATTLPWLGRFLPLAAGAAALTLVRPGNVVVAALLATATGLAYAAVMLGVVLRDPLGAYVRPRLARARAALTPGPSPILPPGPPGEGSGGFGEQGSDGKVA